MRIALALALILAATSAHAEMTVDQRARMSKLFEAEANLDKMLTKYTRIKAEIGLGGGEGLCIAPGTRHCDETVMDARHMVTGEEMRVRGIAAADIPGAQMTIATPGSSVADLVTALDINHTEIRAILDAYARLP